MSLWEGGGGFLTLALTEWGFWQWNVCQKSPGIPTAPSWGCILTCSLFRTIISDHDNQKLVCSACGKINYTLISDAAVWVGPCLASATPSVSTPHMMRSRLLSEYGTNRIILHQNRVFLWSNSVRSDKIWVLTAGPWILASMSTCKALLAAGTDQAGKSQGRL